MGCNKCNSSLIFLYDIPTCPKCEQLKIVPYVDSVKIADYYIKLFNKMEIDGIAISNSEVFVIEVKGWKSRRFIEEKTTREQLDRDIKNAIDGIHISHNTGKIKQKVPLSKKVEWVIKNKQLLKINPSTHITGLLVINEPPTISEYKSCKVQFIDDFEFN